MTRTWIPVHRAAPMSPQDALTFAPARSFAGQTIRQVIHLYRGGPQIRVHVSNRFGAAALALDEVRAARHTGAGAIDAATDTIVTFDGVGRITIAPGETRISDPVALAMLDDAELAVSIFLTGPSGAATHHQGAPQPGYLTPGNTTADAVLTDAETLDTLFWITGVDVLRDADGPVIAAFGDSLSNGDGSTPGARNGYPDQLTQRLGQSVLNLGISGNRLLRDGFGQAGLARFDADVLAIPGVTHAIIELGVNDIGLAGLYNLPLPQAGEITRGLHSLARRAQDADLVPIIATITPHGDAAFPGFYSTDSERTRQDVNAWLREQASAHPVLDIDAALRDPRRPAFLNPAFDSGDHLHPNDAGHQAIAAAFDPAILSRRRGPIGA
jgi:lysophospholipase L1-like esterase